MAGAPRDRFRGCPAVISLPEIVIEAIACELGERVLDNAACAEARQLRTTGFTSRRVVPEGVSLFDLCLRAARQIDTSDAACVIAATFSDEVRFPALSVRLAAALGLPAETLAFDLQMACSAYPYALFLAGQIASAQNRRVLVVHGDIQSRLTDGADGATNFLFSDAATATLVSASPKATSRFAALSQASDALACPADGPIRMDGFRVFSFVAENVLDLLGKFPASSYEVFVPHQANLYMVRQLASGLGAKRTLVSSGAWANPGGCSIPLVLSENRTEVNGRRVLLAGFGAGLSASALTARIEIAEGARRFPLT